MNETPKQFVMQLGAIVGSYVALVAFLLLGFSLIDLLIPDTIESYWEVASAGNQARAAIALLIVAVPTVLLLTKYIHRYRSNKHSEYTPIVRWLIYLSIFVGSTVLLGYVVGIITQFLNGELTIRFILKALLAGAAIGGAMWFYLKDTQGHWEDAPHLLQRVGWAVLGVSTAVILLSFTIIDSPATVREVRVDQDQIEALRDVEWRIDNVIDNQNALPESIADVYPDNNIPEAPNGREAYSFGFTSDTYELCATFHKANPETDTYAHPEPKNSFTDANQAYHIDNFNTWDYEAGRHCFMRTVSFGTSTDDTR